MSNDEKHPSPREEQDDGDETSDNEGSPAEEGPTDSEATSPDGSDGETDERPDSIADVATILVDPADIVQSLAYNGQEDVGPKGKVVFSLTPPFDEQVEPTIRHLDDDSTESKAEDEIHIRPFRLVMDGRQVIDQRPTRKLAKAELDADEPSESAIEAWIDEAMETWKGHIRENLAESVDIYSPQGMAFVDVAYTDNE